MGHNNKDDFRFIRLNNSFNITAALKHPNIRNSLINPSETEMEEQTDGTKYLRSCWRTEEEDAEGRGLEGEGSRRGEERRGVW